MKARNISGGQVLTRHPSSCASESRMVMAWSIDALCVLLYRRVARIDIVYDIDDAIMLWPSRPLLVGTVCL